MPKPRTDLLRRRLVLATPALLVAGCWGGFNLTGRVYDWNGHFDNKWVKWVILVAFIILPVYGATLFVDALIINTIEFYSGNNPIQRPGPNAGGSSKIRPTKDPNVVRIERYRDGELVGILMLERLGNDELRLLAEDGTQLAQVGGLPSGGAQLRNTDGQRVARLSRADIERVETDINDGAPIADSALRCLEDNGGAGRVLAMRSSLEHSSRV